MKTRFAPSPTGLIHLGNARTALFSALYAEHTHGTFLLRIEDTDRERSKEEYTQALMRDLCWLGCKWGEGPDIGGEYGPYWQSEREAIYNRYFQILEQKGIAYPCFCSEEQLALFRKVQLSAGQPPRYPGTCRNLSTAEVAEKVARGLKPTLRFHVADNEVIEFTDLVKGSQKYLGSDIGDFIIRRGDGFPSFMFTNPIDDSLMKVTHVLRGDDHLTNTPRQLLILKALGLTAPIYGHISMITGADGAPLSKRTGSKSLQELHEEGWLPEAVVNYLARLGHYYADTRFMSFTDLATQFALENLSKSPARFDPQQLLHWQKEAVNHLNNDQFWQWIETDNNLNTRVPADAKTLFITAVKPNTVFPKDVDHWAHIFFGDTLPICEENVAILTDAGTAFFDEAIQACTDYQTDVKAIIHHLQQTLGVKGKALFMPIRVALTGEQHGPELALIAQLLGTDKMLQRFTRAKELCHA
jgi:nondiscriminating glutamyl-tRNA synthetase